MGAFNATKKVVTLLGGRPYKNVTCPEIVDTVQKTITTPTEKILTYDKMADTEDVETSLPEMVEIKIPKIQARQDIEEEAEGVLQAPNHSDGSSLITTSDPREDRASDTLTTVDISGQDNAAAGKSGGAAIATYKNSEANDGEPEDHQSNVTPFSAVLAPNTTSTLMLGLTLTFLCWS